MKRTGEHAAAEDHDRENEHAAAEDLDRKHEPGASRNLYSAGIFIKEAKIQTRKQK